MNDLKASGLNKALLINFGSPKPEYKRLVFHLRHLRIKRSTTKAGGADRQDGIC